MKLSVVMPVFNEAGTLPGIIKRVLAVPLPFERELVIVNDGSTDATKCYLDALAHPSLRVIHLPHNQGKGAALRQGFRQSTGDMVVIQDADLEYHPEDYPKLLKPILDGDADVVYGSRFKTGDSHRVLFFWHAVGNTFLTLVSNMMTNLNLSDMETGFKAFTRDIVMRLDLQEDRFGIEPEITAKISKMRCRIYEVGISYSGRTYAEGKKITWRDSLSALRCIIQYNLFK